MRKERKLVLMFGSTKTGLIDNTTRICMMTHCMVFRVSGLSGPQTHLDIYLQENGIETLFFAGVNADQVCINGFS